MPNTSCPNGEFGCTCDSPLIPAGPDGTIQSMPCYGPTPNNPGGFNVLALRTNYPNEIEFHMNMVDQSLKNRNISVLSNPHDQIMSIIKGNNIAIIDDHIGHNIVVTAKPASQEIVKTNPRNEQSGQISNIEIPKDENVTFTPINMSVAMNPDINFSKSVKITIPKEEKKIEIGDNIKKLDEIKQKLVFDKIPKSEKINSPLSE